MRYLLGEASSKKVYSTVGTFADGDTMSINVYKDGSSTPEALTAGTLTQIGTTGVYYWSFFDLVTAPTAYSEYYWIMSDDTTKKESGLATFGGWPELLLSLPANLQAADSCRITTSLYEGDGSCKIEPSLLSDPNKDNYIYLKTSYWDGTRYYELGKYKPSYDQLTGQAYFILPQGATVDVKLESFGINETSQTVPSSSTSDLYTWLNP